MSTTKQIKTILNDLLKYGQFTPKSNNEKLSCEKIAKILGCFISSNNATISIQLRDVENVEKLLNEGN